MASGLSVAVVGLGFGRAFVPIYQAHPNVDRVVLCERNAELLQQFGDEFGIPDRYEDLDQILQDGHIDAVHLLTQVPRHVEQTLAVLNAGKHCACAVPMGTTLDGLRQIVEAEKRSGKNYMMMETAAYSREFLLAKDLYLKGELGELTFLRGTYFQDLEGDYPDYWRAQPPMHYATHSLSPIFALTGRRAAAVRCMGSGRLRPDLQMPDGNVFPLQTAIFELEGTHIVAAVTKSWFQVARSNIEAFDVYGDKGSFEWEQLDGEGAAIFKFDESRPTQRRNAEAKRMEPPFRPDLLPPELHAHMKGWHGGSHPHLVHEFISSIAEGRPSAINAKTAANWTAAGICANDSSLINGERVTVPTFY